MWRTNRNERTIITAPITVCRAITHTSRRSPRNHNRPAHDGPADRRDPDPDHRSAGPKLGKSVQTAAASRVGNVIGSDRHPVTLLE